MDSFLRAVDAVGDVAVSGVGAARDVTVSAGNAASLVRLMVSFGRRMAGDGAHLRCKKSGGGRLSQQARCTFLLNAWSVIFVDSARSELPSALGA